MRHTRRLLSACLVLAMALSLLPGSSLAAGMDQKRAGEPATGTEDKTQTGAVLTGSITVTLEISYAQTAEELKARGITAELKQEGYALVSVPLTEQASGNFNATGETVAKYQVTQLNGSGVPLSDGSGEAPKYLKAVFSGVPQGKYSLELAGTGYKPYKQDLSLDTHSLVVTPRTGDATFTLGDVNKDGKVSTADRDKMLNHMDSRTQADIDKYDLDGDGAVDIVDLAYVDRLTHATGESSVLKAELLVPGIDEAELKTQLKAEKTEIVKDDEESSADFEDIFRDNGKTVKFESTDASSKTINIPIPLQNPVPMSEVVITSPEGDGKIESGTVIVEDENGKSTSHSFNTAAPAGVHAIGEEEGKNVIRVNLGRKVPVKKITISVSKTESGGYAAVETVQFLEDIVDEGAQAENQKVLDLRALTGSEKVTLTWSLLPNTASYRITYVETGGSKSGTVDAEAPPVTIEDLENLRQYEFTIQPLDSAGKPFGQVSNTVYATPKPSSAPEPPDRVSVTALDRQLQVSWTAKNANYCQLYIKGGSYSDFTLYADRVVSGSVTVTGLVNGTEYTVYVVAVNDVGTSGRSREYTGTPVGVENNIPTGIPTEGLVPGSEIEKVELQSPGNVLGDLLDENRKFDAGKLTDGDYSTYWQVGNWNGDEHVNVTFKTPQDLSAVIWVPRLDGEFYKNLRAYSVTVWYEGEEVTSAGHLLVPNPDAGGDNSNVGSWPNISNHSTRDTDRFAVMPIGAALKVKKISVACEQEGYTSVTLSELKFMKYDEHHRLPEEIDALFADGLHTELTDAATEQKIQELENRLSSDEKQWYLDTDTMKDELALAKEIRSGSGSTGLFIHGLESRSAGNDNGKFSQSGSDLQPLGITGKASVLQSQHKETHQITIYAAGIPEGETVTVYATQYNAEVTAWKKEAGKLVNGKNVLTIPKIGSRGSDDGGSLYVSYSGKDPGGIELHIRRGTKIPVLKLENWYGIGEEERKAAITGYLTELDSYISAQKVTETTQNYLNVTEISTPRVLLSLPAFAVQKGLSGQDDRTETLYNAVLAWEELIRICEATQGIIETTNADNANFGPVMESRQNIRCMTMFTGAFMYAAGNHIGIGYGSCSSMVCGKPTSMLNDADANSIYGWGIAHEVGHNMDKLGKAECTNNIYSIMAQTWDGEQGTLSSRLELENRYEDIFTKTAMSRPGSSNNVFIQLGMYWQLHLAYDDADPFAFYNRFFKEWKANGKDCYSGDFDSCSYDEKVALTASYAADKDLTEFFKHWGMTLSSDVKNAISSKYGKEGRAIWYLSDQSRRDRLASRTGLDGGSNSIAVTATKKNDTEIELTITPSISAGDETASVQGYEILRNSTPVAFVPYTEENKGQVVYTDQIAGANNQGFTYTVTAYDTLGNKICEPAASSEIYISFDRTIDRNLFDYTYADQTASFKFKKDSRFTGIKVTNLTEMSGEYTVTITKLAEDGTELPVQTVRSGDFSEGNQKKDESETYVAYLNKPGEDSSDSRLWTYDVKTGETVKVTGIPAGAEVDLISYADDFITLDHIGKLDKAYYDIPEGSLIATGSYRGDPRFGGIRLYGRYSNPDAKTGEFESGSEVSENIVERYIDGTLYMLAELEEDNEYTTISDGIYIFVFNEQAEMELQGKTETDCSAENLLPFEIKAEFYQTVEADSTEGSRMTAQTAWIPSPGGDDLPVISLESEDAG